MKAMRFLASLIVILSAGLALPHEAHATPKSPPLHHTRLLKPVHANGVNQDSYSFLVLNETNYLWSDGHGDETLDQTLLGLSTPGASDTTWCFDWDSGAYSNIRANDDSGPLTVNYYTDPSNSSGVCADVDFRYEVDTGEQYHFILYITIGGMRLGRRPTGRPTGTPKWVAASAAFWRPSRCLPARPSPRCRPPRPVGAPTSLLGRWTTHRLATRYRLT